MRFTVLVLVWLGGCTVGGGTPSTGHDGADPADGDTADTGPDAAAPPVMPDPNANCAERARWIYVVDNDRSLLRFEPDTRYLTQIGRLDCPVSAGGSPFSMAIDRSGTAWVLYNTGEVFRVSTLDASCERTTFERNQRGFEVFGMGFATTAEGSSEETLYLAGGSAIGVGARDSQLGKLDLQSLAITSIGTVSGSPELTGTADAQLWGFSPAGFEAGSIEQFDKTNARVLSSLALGQLESEGAEAWAFAFWGGAFYVFIKTFFTPSTEIWKIERDSGRVTRVVASTGHDIVGAGVSTCAPFNLI